MVAQADGWASCKTAMKSVTDAAHLDRTPRMRLVDAVDVEASNRASLLFELREQSSRQFALYRVIGARSEPDFSDGHDAVRHYGSARMGGDKGRGERRAGLLNLTARRRTLPRA